MGTEQGLAGESSTSGACDVIGGIIRPFFNSSHQDVHCHGTTGIFKLLVATPNPKCLQSLTSSPVVR
jgi:hypothetical protein